MTVGTRIPQSPSELKRPEDVQGWVDLLRARVATLKPDARIDQILWGLSGAVDRIVAEHSGMARELLSVYEQLGIVFEVTGRLSTVQCEREVVDLFVESLRRSFDRRVVFVVRQGPGEEWSTQGCELTVDEWIKSLVNRARDTSTVLVETPPVDMEHHNVAETMVGPVFAGDAFVFAIVLARGRGVPEFVASDMSLLESLTTFCGDLIRSHRLMRELRMMSFSMVRSLVNAVDQKDEYTSGHSLRVGHFATLLGKRVGLHGVDIELLQWGALLHDVGKIGIRDDVLKKAGKLTPEELDHIKEHPTRSHRVVQEIPQLAGALEGVLHHHERYDGTGYPAGLAREEIPLQARIIQIADVFDALTSTRSYRAAYDWRKALAILKDEAGKLVDPNLCRVFDELIHGLLDGDDNAWDRLVEQANAFAQAEKEDLGGDSEGE